MRARYSTGLILGLVVTAAACGPGPREEDDGGDDGPPDAMTVQGPPDASCGDQVSPIELVELGDPPDLLIVLDRSGSMTTVLGTGTRWTVMRDALNGIASTLENNIRFGLVEFPYDESCGVGPLALRVPVDLGQAPEIADYFVSRVPGGATPSELGLIEALNHYNAIPVNPEGRYVLFATDGEPTCGSAAATVAAVTSLANAGIKTYVLGFGGGFTSDQVLNDSAIAGLVPRPNGPPFYYAANNAAELDMVLLDIAGGIAVPSCAYMLATPPPDPDNVTVTINGVIVPRSPSHTNGWDYYPDMGTITLFGTWCDQIQNGGVTEVTFSYGCPGPIEE